MTITTETTKQSSKKLKEFKKSKKFIQNIHVQQLKLFASLFKNEGHIAPIHNVDSQSSTNDRNVVLKLKSNENQLKRLNKTKEKRSYYQTVVSFDQALDIVLRNLRAEGRNQTADQIEELALYVSGLEQVKASGLYKGTEMEQTLDANIQVNKAKLINIINQLLQ